MVASDERPTDTARCCCVCGVAIPPEQAALALVVHYGPCHARLSADGETPDGNKSTTTR